MIEDLIVRLERNGFFYLDKRIVWFPGTFHESGEDHVAGGGVCLCACIGYLMYDFILFHDGRGDARIQGEGFCLLRVALNGLR